MTRLKLLAVVTLLLAGTGGAAAAPDVAQAPMVARTYLEGVRARGFAAEADLLHPDELARFQGLLLPVLEADEAAGGRALLNATFGRDASLLDARLADPADFMRRFARVMAVRMPDQPVGFDELQVLGLVEEGDKVHVLVRLRTVSETDTLEELQVVTLLPDGDEWRLALSPRLLAAVRAIQPAGRNKRPSPRLVPLTTPPPPLPPGAESQAEEAQETR